MPIIKKFRLHKSPDPKETYLGCEFFDGDYIIVDKVGNTFHTGGALHHEGLKSVTYEELSRIRTKYALETINHRAFCNAVQNASINKRFKK